MKPIDKPRWQALSPLLDELLDTDPPARERRLEAIAAADPVLAAELGSLLAEHDAADRGHFLEHTATTPVSGALLAGETVDRYTLDSLLGEGGMGSVWLAHRNDGRYEGQVAIKFLRSASIGPAARQRFEREGHLLARLKHPNIAHLLDAGVTPSGHPYLILEYVEGERLDTWCERRALDIRARIELLLQVFAAVSHAHGKLILHRDLKPSNILVTAEGQVKLLDFGIAKLLEDDDAKYATELTHMAGRAFTLDYAAPEQIQGGEVTMATDVYSLGVLLYLILTGAHPTAGESVTPAERLRAVVETEPRRPSAAVVRTNRAEGDTPRDSRLARALRGDLDNIVVTALKKAPADRYQSADAFAQDLRNYLDRKPIRARPDSLGYRVRKFVLRNALPVVAASAVIVTLAGAAIVSVWQAREATRQRDRAIALSARNAAVVDFVSSMLFEVAPSDQPIRMSELLERSEQLLLGGETDAEHQAAILDVLGDYYLAAGNPRKAQILLDRSLQLTEKSQDSALKATLICNSAYAISLLNERDEALLALESGIAMSRDDPLAAARCLRKRAFLAHNFNDPEAALKYALEAQAYLRNAPFRKPEWEAALLGDVAYAHYLSGRAAEADRYYAQALARYKQLGRAESPATFTLRNNWGIASFAAGDNLRALANYEEALRISKQRDPDGEPPAYLLSNRALALASLARYPEALQSFDEANAVALRANNVAGQLHALVNRAGTYLAMGEVERAENELREIEEKHASVIPADSVPALTIGYLQGLLASARGDQAAALALFTAAVDFFDARQMLVAPLVRALSARAAAHADSADFAAARRDVQRALDIARQLQGSKPHSSLTGLALLQGAEVEAAAGAMDLARAAAEEAVFHLEQTLGRTHPDAQRALALARAQEQEAVKG